MLHPPQLTPHAHTHTRTLHSFSRKLLYANYPQMRCFQFKCFSTGQQNILITALPKRTSSVQYYDAHQVVIAQWLARRLATGVVWGSDPGKGYYLLISD